MELIKNVLYFLVFIAVLRILYITISTVYYLAKPPKSGIEEDIFPASTEQILSVLIAITVSLWVIDDDEHPELMFFILSVTLSVIIHYLFMLYSLVVDIYPIRFFLVRMVSFWIKLRKPK